jgi:H+/Cl- antiporter ClcA
LEIAISSGREKKSMTSYRVARFPVWQELLIAGVIASMVALMTTFLSLGILGVASDSLSLNYRWLYVGAALSAGIIGPLLWWLLYRRDPVAPTGRGIAVGMIAALLCYPFVWASALFFSQTLGAGNFMWLGKDQIQAYHPLALVGQLSLISLLYTGWITVIIGGVGGWLLEKLLSKRYL